MAWPCYNSTTGVSMILNTGASMRATTEWKAMNAPCALYTPKPPMPPGPSSA